MGVKGLTAFIDDNPVLLQDYKLHDCKVILDGNNFIHFVYNKYSLTFQYDGDYFNYYKKIQLLFSNFKLCNIHPYVIFDGGYEVSDSKLRTLKERAAKRIKQAINQNSLLPILARKAFLETLDKLHIPHVTCDFEADEEIAILANQWNCPVISNDSDFFVYRLKAGFLPLNYVDFRPMEIKHKYHYLATQKYHFNHYKQILDNFHPEMIPLLATVLGNDFIKQDTFMAFTEKFKKPKHKIKYASKTVSKITAIISHFDQFKTFSEGRAAITKDFDNIGGIASLQNVIDTSIKCYTKINSAKTYLTEYFDSVLQYSSISRKDYFGQPFPEFMIKGLFDGSISPHIQNMAVLHRIILPCQQEDLNQPSSHKISTRIRQVIYGILFQSMSQQSNQKGDLGKKSKVSRHTHVEEIDRIRTCIASVFVDPRINFIEYGKLPTIMEISQMSLSSRRELVLKSLGVSEGFLSCFHPSSHFLIAVLNYWVYYSEVSKQEIESLILTILILKIKTLINDTRSETTTSNRISAHHSVTTKFYYMCLCIQDFILSLVNRHVIDIDEILGSLTFSELVEINLDLTGGGRQQTFPDQILHLYSEYQSCLLFTSLLNQLLQSPLNEPNLWEIYDGRYVYYFNNCLMQRQAVYYNGVDILTVMEKHPKLLILYKSITNTLIAGADSRPNKRKKSKRKSATVARINYRIVLSLLCIFIIATIVLIYYQSVPNLVI
ncbi:hypothetical protein SNE40_013326 [Patella caerulea]|uniref:XPG N-terminal domain-containing protein n=1 Tax=Patella caerulea TaxID=87958 RepID=A0AAN8JNE8_PATCE